MGKTRPYTSNFTRGEVSDYISSRPDLGSYYNALKRGENIIILPEGGATRRPGSTKCAQAKYQTKKSILIPFSRQRSLSYIIEAGDFYFRFFRANGTPITIPGSELITNGNFDDGVNNWVDYDNGTGISQPTQFNYNNCLALIVQQEFGYGQAARTQTISVTAGQQYSLTFTILFGTCQVLAGDGLNPATVLAWGDFPVGTHTINFFAVSSTAYISLYLQAGYVSSPPVANLFTGQLTNSIGLYNALALVDNVSCKIYGGTPYELVTPYAWYDLPSLQWQQSVDVLFLNHPKYAPRQLSNLADDNWTLSLLSLVPPPTVEDEPTGAALSGATLTPGATTGTGVTFTASSAGTFLAGDVGRRIVYGSSVGIITAVADPLASVSIVIDFPNTNPIPAADWRLTLSPQVQLDPNAIQPVGAQVTIDVTSATDAFRAADVGKFIRMDGGVVEITSVVSAAQVIGIIRVKLSDADDAGATAMAPAGSWSLEIPAWSDTKGWPKAIEFHQGRLLHGGNNAQPTTWWGSSSDAFDNYGVGSKAADAYQFTLRSRKANPLSWLASNGELFIGDEGGINLAKGPGQDEPLGGNVIPYIRPVSSRGAAPIQPVNIDGILLYVHSSRSELCQIAYSLEKDRVIASNTAILGRHLADPKEGGSLILQGAVAYGEKPNSVLYVCRDDGILLALTYYEQEKVLAWTRFLTEGLIESVACIPNPNNGHDRLFAIIDRNLNGVDTRMVEMFDDDSAVLQERKWTQLTTDCATFVYHTGGTGQFISGNTGQLDYLLGKPVDVIYHGTGAGDVAGRYIGRFTVNDDGTGHGQIITDEELTAPGVYEIGLRFTPTVQPVRPAIPNANIEGIPRKWNNLSVRLKDTVGLTINGREVSFDVGDQPMDQGPQPFTGDKQVVTQGWDNDGYITLSQSFPGPMTILGIYGELEIGGR